jgi:hypothetical protein
MLTRARSQEIITIIPARPSLDRVWCVLLLPLDHRSTDIISTAHQKPSPILNAAHLVGDKIRVATTTPFGFAISAISTVTTPTNAEQQQIKYRSKLPTSRRNFQVHVRRHQSVRFCYVPPSEWLPTHIVDRKKNVFRIRTMIIRSDAFPMAMV